MQMPQLLPSLENLGSRDSKCPPTVGCPCLPAPLEPAAGGGITVTSRRQGSTGQRELLRQEGKPSVFLAGGEEMGQKKVSGGVTV